MLFLFSDHQSLPPSKHINPTKKVAWSGKATLFLLFLTFSSWPAFARHIIGGSISMIADPSVQGRFTLNLYQYWDDQTTEAGSQDPNATLLIYSKNGNVLVETITLPLLAKTGVSYGNTACAQTLSLRTTQARYSATRTFDWRTYNDPQGYYIVWERCCRNNNVSNIANPVNVGMVFYLEFPPMNVNGNFRLNSTPSYIIPNGEYICINKPFTMPMQATDADGDELRYSLVTPMRGYTSDRQVNGQSLSYTSYPLVQWGTGYSLQQIIPGNPALTINQQTGQISVTANQQGLFLFTILCEEYRNGQRIGAVRLDFQLPVVDCPLTNPPPAVVSNKGQKVSQMQFCQGMKDTLHTESAADWNLQWQRDGINIPNETKPYLVTSEAGVYTVRKSAARTCGRDTVSEKVTVTVLPSPDASITAAPSGTICAGNSVTLSTTLGNGYQYEWTKDGVAMANANTGSVSVKEQGVYAVSVNSQASSCKGTASQRVEVKPLPTVTLTPNSLSVCAGETATLEAKGTGGVSYIWYFNGNILTAKDANLNTTQAGIYQVRVTDAVGCTNLSTVAIVSQTAAPTIRWDSINPICLEAPAFALAAAPGGGIYTGMGIDGAQFDPKKAGVGIHTVTYKTAAVGNCSASITKRVEVLAPPQLQAKTHYRILQGSGRSVTLEASATPTPVTYTWSPPTGLDNPNQQNPKALPTETTTYQVVATTPEGCQASALVTVELSSMLFIPDAFSPNADGVNDTWMIENMTANPTYEVLIYNRWGSLVYLSQGYQTPWDGTYEGQPAPAGGYPYLIRDSDKNVVYRGQVFLVR
ncbi:gliding motility-associated C-terminal domain-containing protein [Tellurirhabdus bombi]|uniref:gliding motility-associated C-terminal domain-containing protein n=1 Tax=Tellurirhabdus bombi TaxID=2907205 RepID=UPI001F2ED0E2|nr:gliding motility-associated C-terminal domain-containing protein [Tellurirhabdus bombi]